MARKPVTDTQPPPDFETALAELETVVERLERGDLQLQDALRNFERGVQLTRHCQMSLSAAQQKVEILLKEGARAQIRDFHADGADRNDD